MSASAYDTPPEDVVGLDAKEIDKWIIPSGAVSINKGEKHRAYSVGTWQQNGKDAQRVILTSHLCQGSQSAIAEKVIALRRASEITKNCLPFLGVVFPSEDASQPIKEIIVVSECPSQAVLPIEKLVRGSKTPHQMEHVVCAAYHVADSLHKLCQNGLSLWGHAITISGVLVTAKWELHLLTGPNQIDWNTSKSAQLAHQTPEFVELISEQKYDESWTVQEARWEDLRAFLVFLTDLLSLCDGDQVVENRVTKDVDDLLKGLPDLLVPKSYKDTEVKLFSRYLSLLPQWETLLTQDIDTAWTEVKRALTNSLVSRIFEQTTKEFWRIHFPCQVEVPLQELIDRLYEHSQKPYTRDSKCYQATFSVFSDILNRYDHYECAVTSIENITMRDLKNILAYFGPIDNDLLETVVTCARSPWFHGMVSKNELNERLQGAGEGKFLIRFSASQKGSYALSRFVGGKVESYIIGHSFGQEYVFAKHEFSSLRELVFHKKREWKLEPCEGSPFRPIFDPKSAKHTCRYTTFDVLF